jgi:hypothetical protein
MADTQINVDAKDGLRQCGLPLSTAVKASLSQEDSGIPRRIGHSLKASPELRGHVTPEINHGYLAAPGVGRETDHCSVGQALRR